LGQQIVEELRERAIKNFLDIFILTQLTRGPKGGYGIISLIHKKFDVLVSSGTVYSTLYALERDGLIKGEFDKRKRVYTLTSKGRENLENIRKANGELQNLLKTVLQLNAT
jgi:DNA-binding PadR family transcriptional regulator